MLFLDKKMTVNLHTHTVRCHHASGNEREYIQNAISEGMNILGFSDHAPYAFPDGYYSGFRMAREAQKDYVDTLKALKDEYKATIDIKIGYELEYYPKFFSDTTKLITQYDVDYLILGQHYLGNETGDVYSGQESDSEAFLERYVDQVIEGMDTGIYTYVAHPDLCNFVGDNKFFDKHYSRLIEHSVKTGIPLEINFLGIRVGKAYPRERFFMLCGEIGAPVCCGCDAHAPDDLSDHQSLSKAVEWIEKYKLNFVPSPTLRKVCTI